MKGDGSGTARSRSEPGSRITSMQASRQKVAIQSHDQHLTWIKSKTSIRLEAIAITLEDIASKKTKDKSDSRFELSRRGYHSSYMP